LTFFLNAVNFLHVLTRQSQIKNPYGSKPALNSLGGLFYVDCTDEGLQLVAMARRKNQYKLFLKRGGHWASKSLTVLYRYTAEYHFNQKKKPDNSGQEPLEDTLSRLNFFLDFVVSLGIYFIIFAIRKRAEINKTEVHEEKNFTYQCIDEAILYEVMKEHRNERKRKNQPA